MDTSLQHHRSYIGRPVSELPTPCLIIKRPVLEQNIRRLHGDVAELGIAFRPHVKTLKTIEATRLMLGGRHRRIVASTLCEIRGALPLVKEGELDECLYGLPVRPSVLPELDELSKSVGIVLMIDHEDHVRILEQHVQTTGRSEPWNVFIKVDVGSHRAGIMGDSSRLASLIHKVESSTAVSIYGFYCHAGHSYACHTAAEVTTVLEAEVDGVVNAAQKISKPGSDRPLVLSIGATPTAHVVSNLKRKLPANMVLELHAGNFPANDLQQVATGLVAPPDQAVRVMAEVCSVYPERNEALVNAGVVALSRETSSFGGFGQVVGSAGWSVVRLAQEHGILGWIGPGEEEKPSVSDLFSVGKKVFLYIQHACITAAAFYVYYVVDEDDVVRETWLPWKGW